MDSQTHYIERSYQVSILILILLALAALSVIINFDPGLSRYLFGLPVILSGLLGIYGSFFIIKGISAPTDEKKIIAVTVNFAMVLLIFSILFSNTLHRI